MKTYLIKNNASNKEWLWNYTPSHICGMKFALQHFGYTIAIINYAHGVYGDMMIVCNHDSSIYSLITELSNFGYTTEER